MSDGSQVWIFDVQDPDRTRPRRGVVHEVHQPTAQNPVLCVSGAMLMRHDDMVRSGITARPFLKMPIVASFTICDPVPAGNRWPHNGKFAALSFTEGTSK